MSDESLYPEPGSASRREPVGEYSESQLRALIRLIPPARALRHDLEKGLHLQFDGLGDQALKSLSGLQASLRAVCDDPFVETLEPVLPDGADDRQKVAAASLVAGQLLAFLEGQVGLPASGEGAAHYQTAPNISINGPIGGMGLGAVKRAIKIARKAERMCGEGKAGAQAFAFDLGKMFEDDDEEADED